MPLLSRQEKQSRANAWINCPNVATTKQIKRKSRKMTTEVRKCLCCDAEFTVVLPKNGGKNTKVCCNSKCSHKYRATNNREYRAYIAAKGRTTNPKIHNYKNYGGRGIEFRFKSFAEFIADIGPRPSPLHSLDRIRTNGHYEVGNVVWATKQEQARNRRVWKHTSQYKGVSWNTQRRQWKAEITLLDKTHKYIGMFKDEDDAGRAVADAEITYGITSFVDNLALRSAAVAVAAA